MRKHPGPAIGKSRKDWPMLKELPSPEDLRKLLRYEPATGRLFWRERSARMFNLPSKRSSQGRANNWNSRYSGKEAFTSSNTHGYKQGHILNAVCQAHRVIWAIHTGKWPSGEVDHINGNRTDNRICNLRVVTSRDNSKNLSLRCDNTSGAHGVGWHPTTQKWRARIKAGGKSISLGLFAKKDDAIKARKAAEKRYGFHANHGR